MLELPKDTGGVLVTEVEPGGPAAKASVQPGDVIVKIGHEELRGGKAHLQLLLRTRLSGETLDVELLRKGRSVRAALVPVTFTLEMAERVAARRWGMEMVEGESGQGMRVRAVRPKSPAAETGIAPGDVVRNINGTDLRDAGSFTRAVSNFFMDNGVMLVVVRNGRAYHVPLRL